MEMAESTPDALRALLTSLERERDWRNIQKPVERALRRLIRVAAAQQQQLGALAARVTGLDRTDEQLRALAKEAQSDTAHELQRAMESGHTQLTQSVCKHVDARLAAQREDMERTRREELQAAQQRLMEQMQTYQRKNEVAPREDYTQLDALERRLKRLERQQRAAESAFASQWRSWRGELDETLRAKASHAELHEAVEAQTLATVALRDQLERDGAERATRWEAHESEHTRVDAELTKLKNHMHELLGIVETLQSEQATLKAVTIDHVQNSTSTRSTTAGDAPEADTKRAVKQLHDAVKIVRRSVESVAKRAELEALGEQVAWLRRQLRSEIYQARYIWKEGRPTAKHTVAWTAQVVNTNSDVFVWQRSAGDVVTTTVPGLYHLQAAFFTRLEPVLQVLVNGEPALITTAGGALEQDNENAHQNHQAATSAVSRRRLHHSAGDLVGVEIAAFLALPARAVVAITYDIDERAQGFLNLRKL